MSTCDCCGRDDENERCSICKILMPILTYGGSTIKPEEKDLERTAAYFGLVRGHRGEFWSYLDSNQGSDIQWMMDPPDVDESRWIAGPPPEWKLDDEMKEEIESGGEFPISVQARRRLQRGGILPDGTYLSWTRNQFWMDGVPVQVPYLTLEKMLLRDDADSIDWKSLILAMNIACAVDPISRGPHRRFLGMDQRHSAEVCLHPVLQYMGNAALESLDENHQRMAYLNRSMRSNRMGINADSLERFEWFKRWQSIVDFSEIGRNEILICKNIVIKRGRLLLRMKNDTRWNTRRIPANPILIARLLNWTLSPVNHPEHMRFRCLQYGLLTTGDTGLDNENKKGVQFLAGILQHEKVTVDVEKGRFLIEGASGVKWSVTPGDGAHGSRFRVRAIGYGRDGQIRLPRAARNHVCVVETPELRRLVLGDALGGIVLALLDDSNSARRINTLNPVLHEAARIRMREEELQLDAERAMGGPMYLEHQARELAEQVRNEARNAAEEIVIRATVIFPRLWSVILRCQIGTTALMLPIAERELRVTFSNYDTRITLRNQIEVDLVNMMLEAAGWRRSREHENPENNGVIMMRVEVGEPDMSRQVERFGELLEPLITIRERMRLMPGPAWANFDRRNPGPGPLPPLTDGPLD